jgi:hypothetical protein
MALNLLLFIWMRHYAADNDVCVCAEEDMVDSNEDDAERAYGSFSGDDGESGSAERRQSSSSGRYQRSFSGNIRYGGSFSSATGERRISIDDARVQSMSAT